jgi:hypothetical protein
MSDPSFQTLRLGRGAHASPLHGACVVELSSMLAGERFSDHPRSVCPVIAGFLRVYNDRLREHELPELYPLAAMVVGSASSRRVRRRRVRRLTAWAADHDPAPGRGVSAYPFREDAVLAAGHAAVRLPDHRRAATVGALVAELVAMGAGHPEPAFATAPVGAPSCEAATPDRVRVTAGG